MSFLLFIILAAMEIALLVRSRADKERHSTGRKSRLIVRGLQIVVVVAAMLLPLGQRWRFAPVLGLLAVLLILGALMMLIRGHKKRHAVLSCVFSILFIAFFMIPAFVFTGYNGLPVSGEYEVEESSAILVDSSREDQFEQDGSFCEVPVHFYYPKAYDGQCPLVVFSHGAFGYYQSNTSTYMELASNGYVVAALDHPHHAFFTENTEGKLVTVDQRFLNTAMTINGNEDFEDHPKERLALYQDWMALRTADMNFVVDALKRAGESGVLDDSWHLKDDKRDTILAVIDMMDTSKIGLMGHSMGGATSVALGRERDDIAAVIDIDGTMLSEYTGVENGRLTVNEEPFKVPVLEFVNWENYNELAAFIEAYRAEGGSYPNDVLMRNAAAGFTTTIRDTLHMDFTDLPLLSPVLGNMLGSGRCDNAETMGTVNSLVLQFYNCYLKGEGTFAPEEIY